MDSFHLANQLYVDEEYDAAMELYSKALHELPDFSQALSCRSATYIKLKKYTQALEDCNNLIQIDSSIEPAYFRKGLACFELGEYETAKKAFETGKEKRTKVGKDVTAYTRAIRKCDIELEETSEQMSSTPPVPAKSITAATTAAPVLAPALPAVTTAIPNAIKYQYYQNAEAVNISILAKNVTPEETEISILPEHLKVKCRGETVIDKRLYGLVDVGSSNYDIRKTKIEIVLRKVDKEVWPTLEGDGPPRVYSTPPTTTSVPPSGSTNVGDNKPTSVAATTTAGIPKPYASKRDWNAVEQEITKELDAEKPEGEEALQKLFKDIYSKVRPSVCPSQTPNPPDPHITQHILLIYCDRLIQKHVVR